MACPPHPKSECTKLQMMCSSWLIVLKDFQETLSSSPALGHNGKHDNWSKEVHIFILVKYFFPSGNANLHDCVLKSVF
jgi:hypothetical protein